MHSAAARWTRGTVIGWHYRRAGWRPGMAQNAYPVRVVADDERGLATWLAGGSSGLIALRADGTDLRADKATMFTAPRRQAVGIWSGAGVLRIAPTGKPWSAWLFPGRPGWYVNLEDPLRRVGDAVISADHVLDVIVDGTGSIRLKDEDELAEAVRQGRFTAAEADRYRADAEAAGADVRRGVWPFRAGWDGWRPAPTSAGASGRSGQDGTAGGRRPTGRPSNCRRPGTTSCGVIDDH